MDHEQRRFFVAYERDGDSPTTCRYYYRPDERAEFFDSLHIEGAHRHEPDAAGSERLQVIERSRGVIPSVEGKPLMNKRCRFTGDSWTICCPAFRPATRFAGI